jgi:3,4-dihydroxy-2-butanone 4-phosphate synthase
MVRYSSGVICAGLPGERLDQLNLPLMVSRNTDSMSTAYTVTVDYRHGTSTGISASDRAATLRALVDPKVASGDFNRPGHVFPLRAVPGPVHADGSHKLAHRPQIVRFLTFPMACSIGRRDGTKKQKSALEGACLLTIWRRGRDSNPR